MSNRAVYDDPRWRALRQRMRQAGTLCACGCGRRATDLHHIVALKDGGPPFDPDNLEPLWYTHHRAVPAPGRGPNRKA